MLKDITTSGLCVVADEGSVDIPMASLEGKFVASTLLRTGEAIFKNEIPGKDFETEQDGTLTRLRFAHFAGHGSLAPLDKLNLNLYAPEINFGSAHLSDRGDSIPSSQFVFLNVCVGGRIIEDPLEGIPAGLVPRFLLRGAEVVVAALTPVDDLWACVLGLMVVETMVTKGLPLDWALDAAKRQLGSGVPKSVTTSLRDWHFAWLDHVVREHGYSYRRRPEACARVALRVAMGSDDYPTLLAELTSALEHVAERDRAATASQLLACPAWEAFSERLARGPGPAEYGALVHGMIAFGESTPAD